MLESVDLDVFGEIHIDFNADNLVYVCVHFAGVRLPRTYRGLDVNSDLPMRYCEIEWIGTVIRRQWSMLLPAVPFLLLTPMGMAHDFGNWPVFSVSAFLFLALGVFPLFILVRGRSHLGVATQHQILLLPMDRQRKQIGRILGLLKQLCRPTTRWELQGTRFADIAAIDQQPPTGRPSQYQQYAAIVGLLSLYVESNILAANPHYRTIGIALRTAVAVVSIGWILSSVIRSFR
jgi:hypothetical protein